MLLSSLPYPQPTFLPSCDDDDDADENESAVNEEIWLAALGILSQVALHSLEGSRRIAQVQHCCSIAHSPAYA